MRVRISAILTLALVATLATGCTSKPAANAGRDGAHRAAPAGATAPVDAAAWALADRMTTPTYTGDTTAALIAALARSGIGTYADPAAGRPEQPVTGTPSTLRLLDFQAHALAVGVWAGAGYTGAELDAAIPLPDGLTGVATTSELLAGYVAAADSPGGALSRALMTGQNLQAPPALRFPAAVLILFAADLADPAPGLASGGAAPGAAAVTGAVVPVGLAIPVRRQAAGGICSTAADWIDRTIVGFFAALRLATPDSGPGAIAASIWNWLVNAAQFLVQKLISTLTDAVLGTIRSIARMVSDAAEQIVSMLPYAVKVIASGDSGGATFTLGPDPLPGRFTATVSAGDLPDWPSVLADCAEVAKVKLPNFHAKDLPLTWGPLDAPADPLLNGERPAPTDDVTDTSGQAVWSFQTAADPGDPQGEQRNQPDAMPVAVHRPELKAARDRLTYALLGSIPDLLRPYVARLFAPYIDGLESRISALLDARGVGHAFLIFHAGAPPTPTPHPATSGPCAGRVPPGTYTGTNTNDFHERIPMTGGALVDDSTATGPVTLTVAPDGTLTGTWSFQMHDVFDETFEVSGISSTHHLVRTHAMTGGTVGGTACDASLTSGPVRQLSCTGDCTGAPADAPAGTLPHFGAPTVTPGHLTWTMHNNADDGHYTDTFTIAVAGP